MHTRIDNDHARQYNIAPMNELQTLLSDLKRAGMSNEAIATLVRARGVEVNATTICRIIHGSDPAYRLGKAIEAAHALAVRTLGIRKQRRQKRATLTSVEIS